MRSGPHHVQESTGVVVMMVVQPNEYNAFDQRHLEYALLEQHGVRMLRQTLKEVNLRGRLGANGCLVTTTDAGAEVEVGVVYFRAGYTPDDYPSEAEWEARLLMEQSAALCCPNAAYHLAGTKKVQQVGGVVPPRLCRV